MIAKVQFRVRSQIICLLIFTCRNFLSIPDFHVSANNSSFHMDSVMFTRASVYSKFHGNSLDEGYEKRTNDYCDTKLLELPISNSHPSSIVIVSRLDWSHQPLVDSKLDHHSPDVISWNSIEAYHIWPCRLVLLYRFCLICRRLLQLINTDVQSDQHERIQGAEGGTGGSRKNHKNIGFLCNTGPGPLKNHKST